MPERMSVSDFATVIRQGARDKAAQLPNRPDLAKAAKDMETLKDDFLVRQALENDPRLIDYLQTMEQRTGPEPSALESFWNTINQAYVSPETVAKGIVGKRYGGKTLSELESRQPIGLAQAPQPTFGGRTLPQVGQPAPQELFERVRRGERITAPEVGYSYTPGLLASEARFVSGATTPLSIATSALGEVARGAGRVPQLIRGGLNLQGLGYGTRGAWDAFTGLQQGVSTPEGAEKFYGGLANLAGVYPAGRDIAQSVGERVLPALAARGETALIAGLQPEGKMGTTRLRQAWRGVGSDLIQANPRNVEELATVANKGKLAAAQQTSRAIAQASPGAGNTDTIRLGNDIRDELVTQEVKGQRDVRYFRLGNRVMPISVPGPREEYYEQRIRDIRRNYRNQDLAQAEQLVQDLNIKLNAFNRLPDAERSMIMAGGHGQNVTLEIAFDKALKDHLQNQIDQKLSQAPYKALKMRYGHFKEIENASQARLDEMAKALGKESYGNRRLAESVAELFGSTAGALTGGHYGGGLPGGLLGAGAGYLIGRPLGEWYARRAADPNLMVQRAVGRPSTPFAGSALSRLQPVVSAAQPPDQEDADQEGPPY